jgi:pimeloyl-ACP methyl ester carboxylesterase
MREAQSLWEPGTAYLPNTGQVVDFIRRPGPGKQVLYVPGIGCSYLDFARAAAHPEFDELDISAINVPGCGNSTYPLDRRLDIPDLARIGNEFMGWMGIQHAALVGHSMGAIIALQMVKLGADVTTCIGVEPSNALWGRGTPFRARRILDQGKTAFMESGFAQLIRDFTSADQPGARIHGSLILPDTSPDAYFQHSAALVNAADGDDTPLSWYDSGDTSHVVLYGRANPDTATRTDILKACNVPAIGLPGHHFLSYDDPASFFPGLAKIIKNGR